MFGIVRSFLLLGVASVGSAQSTWYVDDDASGAGTGTFSDPYSSLQFAIDRPTTLPGDELVVLPGVYDETVDLRGKSLRIFGLYGAAATILDAGFVGPAFTLTSGEGPGTSIEGLTLRHGAGVALPSGKFGGGGVFASGVQLALRDCVLEDCSGPDLGGGIYAASCTLDMEHCIVRDCLEGGGVHAEDSLLALDQCLIEGNRRYTLVVLDETGSGLHLIDCATSLQSCTIRANGDPPGGYDFGAGLLASGGTLFLSTCLIERNLNEVRGGGLSLRATTATVVGCVFRENQSYDYYYGGAIYVAPEPGPTDLAVYDSVFLGNIAGDGGALYFGAGHASLTGCSFEDNGVIAFYYETGCGGAVFAKEGTLVDLERCLFVGNYSDGNPLQNQSGCGGAVYGSSGTSLLHCTVVDNIAELVSVPAEGGGVYGGTLRNCIVRQNLPDDLAGGAAAEWSCVGGSWPGIGNFDQDPTLWSIVDRDLQLLPESPCIDAGDPASPLDPDGSRADVGALPYERDHCGPRCQGEMGAAFCFAQPNSTGQPARLRALGSVLVADDRVLLFVDDAPPGVSGMLLVSDTDFPRPIGPDTKSRLCLGLPKVLRSAMVDDSGRLDVNARFDTWPAGAVVFAGETWRFQFAFTDADPLPVRNASSALRITFQ